MNNNITGLFLLYFNYHSCRNVLFITHARTFILRHGGWFTFSEYSDISKTRLAHPLTHQLKFLTSTFSIPYLFLISSHLTSIFISYIQNPHFWFEIFFDSISYFKLSHSYEILNFQWKSLFSNISLKTNTSANNHKLLASYYVYVRKL